MLVIHPGYPKTGTTYLQNILRDREWYFGPEKGDAVSRRLCDAARKADPPGALAEIVGEIARRASQGQPTLLTEEAILSLRAYEIAYQIGQYRRIGPNSVADSGWNEPVHKLLAITEAVQGTDRTWLLTVRRHGDWCRSYYRYTLSELGQQRAAIFLAGLAAAQAVGGPLYAPTIRLIRAIDPAAPLVVVPMEAIVDPAHQAEVTRLFADRFGLDVPLAAGRQAVNASAPPLPAGYTRFVRQMTHVPLAGPLRRVGRTFETAMRKRLAGRARGDTRPFEAGLSPLVEAFRQDTAVLQAFCPFDLDAFGYRT